MEELTEGVNNLAITEPQMKNKIQVSNTKKPLFFYVNLAKRYMQQHEEVELSTLGMSKTLLLFMILLPFYTLFIISAIATMVTVAEILKNNRLVVEKSKDL
ncbi:Alba DNA/RNA-binding protein [Zea mays]|uniref:Alba DNA/RNA-binding protein n=1 Tax=Zea mays TaxID=4577 RepID=A0A1D6P2I9_MAIZE|nr:Alba DNA/RNA-binding protein [Zea mays]